MSNKVKVTVNGRAVLVESGRLLSDILKIEKPCGGQGRCGKCKVRVNGADELACRYTVTTDIEVETYESGEIVSESGLFVSGETGREEKLCFALDIGTTTLALALVSLDKGEALRVLSRTNPQRIFGADVMTRIDYCQKNGVGELHAILTEAVNEMISEMGAEVDTMYVAANVTMLHTFFGVDCSSIGVAPYTPTFLESKRVRGEEIGIKGAKNVISLPSISSFVGADIVSGLYLLGMPEEGKYDLLIDLGTNAEAVLYSRESGIATAAAAGPCFEGANISSGMSATSGAVYSLRSHFPADLTTTICQSEFSL